MEAIINSKKNKKLYKKEIQLHYSLALNNIYIAIIIKNMNLSKMLYNYLGRLAEKNCMSMYMV